MRYDPEFLESEDYDLWTRLLAFVEGDNIEEPLVGRVHPATDRPSGRGLWLVNHLCDLVQIRSSPQGTVVRVYMLVAD